MASRVVDAIAIIIIIVVVVVVVRVVGVVVVALIKRCSQVMFRKNGNLIHFYFEFSWAGNEI